jgi:hypothetical protein
LTSRLGSIVQLYREKCGLERYDTPGHSKVGAPLDANTAVAFTETYLLVFEEELTRAKDPDSLIKAMKERFPSAELLLAIERGATANVKP